MAITYQTTPFTFVDSQHGSASNQNIKSLVNVAIDRRYHKEVQKKMFWTVRGMIGPDQYKDGSGVQSAPGVPVIRKTDLEASPGDTIKMGLRTNLDFGINTGKISGQQLVDAEVAPDFYNMSVKIEQWRQGVRFDGGMNAQRNPYESFEEIERDALSDWSAQTMDTSLLYAAHTKYSPNLFRVHGHSKLVPTANPNTLFGNDTTLDTTRTVASLAGNGDDNVKGKTFEIGATYCEENDFDPVLVDGTPYWVALISARARLGLLQDPTFRSALENARERAKDNPLFKWADFLYGNTIIIVYDKIRTVLAGNNPAGLTVGSNTITEAAYTGIGGSLDDSQLHQTVFLGANALAYAEGRFAMAERIRKEDDYQQIIGRAVDNIFGAVRTDFKSEDGNTTYNKSSLIIVNSLVL